MNAEEMKKCPFCAETIRAEAVKCRYCGSMLSKGESGGMAGPHGLWNRVTEGKKIAGVCTGIARQLDAPVLIMPLRVFFVISTLFYFFGPILYVLLWMLMPAEGNQQSQSQQAYYQPPTGEWSAPGGPQPPVVDNYPGQNRAAGSPPPMAGSPAAAPGAEAPKSDGEDQPPHRQPHSVD